MMDALNIQTNLPLNPGKIPDTRGIKDPAEIEKAARDFSSVFFSEYVGIMLDEVEDPDDEFSNDIYRTLHAQMIGKELVNSDPGRKISDMVIGDIIKMQAKQQGVVS